MFVVRLAHDPEHVEGSFVLAFIHAYRFTHMIAMAARLELVALSTEPGWLTWV